MSNPIKTKFAAFQVGTLWGIIINLAVFTYTGAIVWK